MFLATIGFSQVIFRVINHDYVPNSYGMLFVAILALAANLVSYLFLAKTNQEEVHMKASKIFTSNDIVINLGLIVSTVLVHLLHSPIPDLLIGTIVFAIVLKGAFKILSISK
ncbi:cation transporter [Streptococcus uberis]|nr:cation transporter [Streptococcus uberis]